MSLFEFINENKTKKLRSKVVIKPKKKEFEKQRKISQIEKNNRSVENFFLESQYPSLEIVSLTYSVLTKETLNRISVCEITNINKNKDTSNTTNDQRLGTIENNILCATCEKTNEECPGHLGIIRLPVNIIHPFFRLIVMRVLQCVCHTCNSLLLSEKYIRESGLIQYGGFTRLTKIADRTKDGNIRCSLGCPCNPIFKSQKSASNEDIDMFCLNKVGKQEIPHRISVSKIKKILTDISDNDVKLLGFQNNHPKNFIVDFVPVIPISARPYIIREGSQVQDDYLTSTYSDILSKKIEYFQETSDPLEEERKKEECIKRIIFLIEHSIQNCNQEYKRSPSDPCKAINDRLSGKENLIRGHMMGKRADFTGRTVLGPNRSISFGEIAPPVAMMSQLSVPERVTNYNLEYVKRLSDEKKIVYLCPKRGSFAGRKLRYDSKKHRINIGDGIGRFSEDGDVILFNRQPTLHRNSMLGYICKFQEKLSIGIHLSSTGGHNADFDGDEGNIHMLQSIDSQVEGRLLMYAGNNINMSKNSGPAAGITFNGLTGGYLLTREDLVLSEKEFNDGLDYLYNYENDGYVRKNMETLFERVENMGIEEKYSGKILCSSLFPPDFTYTYIMDDVTSIKIRKGILISGQLTKAHLGDSPSTIIQSIYKQYGKEYTISFISNATFLFNWYSEKYGLSISVKDSKPERMKEFAELKDKKFQDLNKEVMRFPELPLGSTETEIALREQEITTIITNSSKEIQKIFFKEFLERNNSLDVMVKSKAKGKEHQILYISAFLGQQVLNGNERPKKSTSGGKRWLSTFHVEDNSIYSRGFCKNSFFEGLNPDEFFANAQASRVGLADQQLRTAQTGTLMRRMVKAQENLTVKYDGTVRNHNNIIFQFNYGAGFASTEMTFSSNNVGMKTRSFINLKELIEKENTNSGYHDFDISEMIVTIFNSINKRYGKEKLVVEEEDIIDVNDLEDFQEIMTFQDDFSEGADIMLEDMD
jgi:DNA-directed RNA polymerase subunit A'